MIVVHRLNNTEFVINPDLIESMEASPDTRITLTTERTFIVKETIPEIIEKVIEYQRLVHVPFSEKFNKE